MHPLDEVTYHIENEDELVITKFILRGNEHYIESIKRTWGDKHGQHFLVFTAPQRHNFELLFQPDEEKWFLVTSDDTPTVPLTL